MNIRIVAILVGCTLISSPVVNAWSKAGHMSTGSVAYRVLKKESPATIPKIIEILKKNPRYAESWKQLIEDLDDGDDADEYLFMLAARWADDVRGDARFYTDGGHEASHHFINKPFKPVGQPEGVAANEPAEINIVRAFPDWLTKLKTESDLKKKSIALCWVMHLIGDAHQPLHSTSLYTEKFQLKDHGRLVGDRGGTWFYVKKTATTNSVTNLHSVWDGLITERDKYRANRNVVTALMGAPVHAPEKFATELTVLDLEKWIDESHELAKTKAYSFNGSLIDGGNTEATAKVLPDGYFTAVEPVAKRRGVLSGYRMAATLKLAVGN